jgi:hypothetical protein
MVDDSTPQFQLFALDPLPNHSFLVLLVRS